MSDIPSRAVPVLTDVISPGKPDLEFIPEVQPASSTEEMPAFFSPKEKIYLERLIQRSVDKQVVEFSDQLQDKIAEDVMRILEEKWPKLRKS